jgi:hypothetical protein
MKDKVITFKDSTEYKYTIERQVREWIKNNPDVNVVSTDMTQGSLTALARIAIIYNYGESND